MNTFDPKDIRELSPDELASFLKEHGEEPFRAAQVHDWLWKKGCSSFEEMTDLSKKTRQLLADHFCLRSTRIDQVLESSDKTLKIAFRLHDQNLVEGVLIPAGNRVTACISSQVGCPLGCKFCATGLKGFTRNLSSGEIFDQVTLAGRIAREKFALPLTHLVYMGMGEPLLNYENVLASIDKITALGMSSRRITVSSAGIAKMIRRLADDRVKFHFALSLHAADDRKRSGLMPINKSNSLSSLGDALKYFHRRTGSRITIEYLLLKDINDSPDDARDVARFCRNFPVKINLIRYNFAGDPAFEASAADRLRAFTEYLEQKNLVVNVRKSRGGDIAAACGQLAGRKD